MGSYKGRFKGVYGEGRERGVKGGLRRGGEEVKGGVGFKGRRV